MDFWAVAAAVFFGNILTLCVLGAFIQFQRHDYKAPWLAYAGFLIPLAIFLLSISTIVAWPPYLDAAMPR